MKLFSKKRVFIGILVVLVLLISYLIYDNYYIFKQAPIGAGVKAKILSSGIFVSKRDPQSVLNDDLSFHSLLGLVKTKIDYEKKSVTATMLGFIKKRAIYREGLGCILLLGVSEEEIKSWPVDIPEPLPVNPEEVPWPSGDLQLEEDHPQNVNQLLLDDALDNVFSEPDQENLRRTRAVVVVHDGRLIAERYAPGFTKDTPLIGWSMTKSVTSALVGILVGQGQLSIDEPASGKESASFLKGWVEYTTTPTPKAPIGEYGAQFWLNKGNPADPKKRLYPRLPADLFFLEGYQGQSVVIIPSRKLVVVRLGMTHKGEWGLESFMVDILKAISTRE